MYFKAKNDGRTGLFRHFPENLFPAARSALKIVLVGVAVSAAAPVMASDVVMDSQDDEALGVQAAAPTDADFRAIFTSWKKMDNVAHATVSIPSRKPVDHISLTSNYRSEEHTSELQSLMRISYAVFCLKKKKNKHTQ